MKLKFRADKKDWIMFGIYAVVLLYVVAIAILNIAQFAFGDVDHLFYGFNPIKAFTPGYIGLTLFAYIVALVASIMSVSDKFFDREKGFGFSMEAKKETGYSKWEDEKKMKEELTKVNPRDEKVDAAGIPLINDGKNIWVDDGEYHNIVIGSTGSGKTEMTVQPMVKLLAKKGESMIITDPKGEIYEKNGRELEEKGYNVVLLNFRDPQKGSGWNPLTLPYELYKNGNKDKANELIDDLAANILYDEAAQNHDPFWEKTSADYFSGLTLALFEDANEDEINLNSVNMFTTVGEEKSGPTTYVNQYFNMKDHNSPAYTSASSTLIAPNETKGSILSVFKQKLRLFAARENISEMLSHSDFDMKDIGRKKTAVFIVIQDEKKTYHSLVTIFLKQCYETLIDVAQENGGKLEYRTNFILDEFANMPPLKDITTMITAARSRKIRFTMIIQNFAQLKQVYGEHDAETIRGNCGNIVYLLSTELASLEEISKLCGEVKSKEKDKTASTPLVTVSDLQRFPKWSIIVIRWRMMPFKTKLEPNWRMVQENAWGKNYELADYPHREKHEVKVFDLKAFVDKKKEERINELIKSNLGDTKAPAPKPMPKKPSSVDVNDLVKRIDARIAELEAEEKAEKEKKAAKVAGKKMSESKPEISTANKNTVEKKAEPEIKKKEEKISSQEIKSSDKKEIELEPKITDKKEESIQEKNKSIEISKKVDKEEPKKENVKEGKKETKSSNKDQQAKDAFAAKITSKLNSGSGVTKTSDNKEPTMKKVDAKDIKAPDNKAQPTNYQDNPDFVTDDQFFDDFFADDDDYY